MEAISPRGTACAVVVLVCACLVAGAGAALPANETAVGPGLNTTAVTAAVTAAVTPTAANATPVQTAVNAALTQTAAPNATAAPFTLVLDRASAVWGDTVRCSGTGADGAVVRLIVDGVETGTAVPSAGGAYRLDYTVDRLPAGVHVVRAEAGPLRIADASLEVVAVDPVVQLEVAPDMWENETALRCAGNVTAAGRPVPGAAVRLVYDGTGTADCTTGPEGQFELLAGIAGGSHKVVANVSFDDGRPINPASSRAVRAELPGGFPVLPVIGALLVLLLVGAGGFFFWRRSRDTDGGARPAPVRPAPARAVPAPEPPVVEAAPAVSPTEELRSAARELAGDGGRDGIEAVYRALVERLAAREPGARLGSMTPRELAAHFAGTPAGVAVARVATCYEAVAYSGRAPTAVDVETMVEGFVAALAETARAGQ